MAQAMTIKLLLKPFQDARHQIGTLENPSGVQLDQRSASCDPLPGGLGGIGPHADQREGRTGNGTQTADHLDGALPQRDATETAGLLSQGPPGLHEASALQAETVQARLTAITPANPSSKASRAIPSIDSSSRSGAIFTSRGGQPARRRNRSTSRRKGVLQITQTVVLGEPR